MKRFPLFFGAALLSAATASAAINVPEQNIREASPRSLEKASMSASLKKADANAISTTFKAPARAASDGWTSIGTGKYTDAILSDFFNGVEVSTFDVEVEQKNDDSNTYRIVNPYANWTNPYSNITYSDDPTNYLVFHILDGGKYAYIEDFNTGIEFVSEDEKLGPNDDYFIKVISQANALIKENGVDAVVSQVPEVLASYENGVIRQNGTFSIQGKKYYSLLIAYGNTSEGYYAGNKNGDFCIQLPGAEIKETTWNVLGKGKYTDDIMASLFQDIESETMEVTVEQDADDPTHFRIPNPYANWSVELENNGKGEFEYHVFQDKYVYFDKLNTGIVLQGSEINSVMNISSAVNQYGLEAVVAQYPDAFGQLKDGVITVPKSFIDGDKEYATMLTPLDGKNYYANYEGKFKIVLPEAHEGDGIETINAATSDAIYYNLQGVRVSQPENGLYIRVNGGKADKVIIR